jgi:protein gp37
MMNDVRDSIGWATHTWNPITGCLNGCRWCYGRALARRFGRSFEPALHPERLEEPFRRKKPARIFVGSVTDFGSEGVSAYWLQEVVRATRRAPWHKYLMLTKRPDRLPSFLRGEPWWFGVSVTCQEDEWRIGTMGEWGRGARRYGGHFFTSCEPLLGPVDLSDWMGVEWLIIGALTRGRTLSRERGGTRPEWVTSLRDQTMGAGCPVFVKHNVQGAFRAEEIHGQYFPQDFPEDLRLEDDT